ncbi:MAG TPA: ATP-binding protein, partial [Chroococcales cyanobacterium]
ADSPVRIGGKNEGNDQSIWVEDLGPGVPEEEKMSVFKKFYRGTAAVAVKSGSGLGLAIAEEIVRFHGGSIWVENLSPTGARFSIALPKEKNEPS